MSNPKCFGGKKGSILCLDCPVRIACLEEMQRVYETDKSGLKILKVKKNPHALEEIEKISKEIYKDDKEKQRRI